MSKTAPAGRSRDGAAPPLLERERELEAVERGMDRLAAGTGSLLLIEGPAGIGKTRLLTEASSLARGRDLLVRSARGGELEREMPFGVIRQLIEPLVERSSEKERSRLLSGSAGLALVALGRPQAEPSDAPTDPFAPIHGLYWLLANISDAQPAFLSIDDLHWADSQTLRFLVFLARRLADLSVLVVASARSGEPGEPAELRALRVEAELIHPNSLTESAVGQLIRAELGREPTAEFVKSCMGATAGNPFLLAEVLRGIRADALDSDREAGAAVAELAPEGVARYALVRLGRFGEDAVAVGKAIAVLGGAPQLRHVAMLAGVEETRARVLCDRLREAEILTPGLPIDFVHPLVRQAIYADLSEGERSAMHRRAAQILAETGSGAREVAPHLVACVPNGDQWVAARLREAAKEARDEGAPDAARTYLERALQEPSDEDLRDRYLLGRVLYVADPPSAPHVLMDVAERTPDPELRLDARRVAALASINVGMLDVALETFAEALEDPPPGHEEAILALEAQLFCFGALRGRRDPSSSERIRAVAAGLEGRTPGELVVRQALAFDRFFDCDPVEEVVELAASFPPPPWEIEGITVAVAGIGAFVLGWSGRWDQAREPMSRFIEASRDSGNIMAVLAGHGELAQIERLSGRLRASEAEARTASEIAAGATTFSPYVWQAKMNLLATLIARGELELAGTMAEEIPSSAGPREIPLNPYPIELKGYLRLERGDLGGAVGDLLAVGETLEEFRLFNPAFCPWRQEAAPPLAALGRTAEAKDLIRVAEERARSFGAPHLIGTVLRSRGLIEPRKRQIDTLGKSVEALERYGPPHELARSLIELGSALRRDGRRSDAREPLKRAFEVAHRCGADGLEQRAREELAAAGGRLRTRFRTGAEALTASELRVAKLAAEGFNNPEIAQRLFVTRRTVETHLTHVYEKLRIGGRRGLRGALTQEGELVR